MGDVSIIKLGVEIVTWVDGVLGLLETLISPLVSVSIVVFRSRNGNFIIDGGGVISKSVPVSRVKRKVGVTSELVDDGVPDGVEVSSTILVGDPLRVTTTVTSGELAVDLSGSVERLMKITDIVDNETESEGATIFLVAEFVVDCLVVVVVSVVTVVLEPGGQVGDSISDIVFILLEIEVIKRTTLVKVWLVDKMPSRLPGVTLTLNVIGEGSALNERIVTFVLGKAGVVFGKN